MGKDEKERLEQEEERGREAGEGGSVEVELTL